MDKQEMIKVINAAMSTEITQFDWCAECWFSWNKQTPVMIWDVLYYMDEKCNWVDTDIPWWKTRDLEKHKQDIITLYNHYIWRFKLSIENQTTECVEYVYSLIK